MERRCWDSSCFIAWLAEEDGRVDDCRGVIRAAEAGKVQIVTSSLAIAEVVKLRHHRPIGPDESHRVRMFFRQPYILVRELDRFMAERAQVLVWERSIDPKDAVHVATAIDVGVRFLDTFDEPLMQRSGQLGDPRITIGRPAFDEQLELPAPAGEASDNAAAETTWPDGADAGQEP